MWLKTSVAALAFVIVPYGAFTLYKVRLVARKRS